MEKFNQHTGIAAPILRMNVDTDAIIPSREMKRVSKEGLGEGLFAAWRYLSSDSREINPSFVLNKPAYENTSILLAGENFGCGSSREHAVWALTEYGIKVIIAPSFGSIFYNNCIGNGLLAIQLDEAAIKALALEVEQNPQQKQLSIDLDKCCIVAPSGTEFAFSINRLHQEMLQSGMDTIDLTLTQKDKIDSYEEKDRLHRPWIYLDKPMACHTVIPSTNTPPRNSTRSEFPSIQQRLKTTS